MTIHFRLCAAILSLLAAFSAGAFEPVQGQFQALEACPATIGISRPPDGVTVRAGELYQALGLNRKNGDYLQIRIAGAKPDLRWVSLRCGAWPVEVPGVKETAKASQQPGRPRKKLLLALSWQPAFCESQPDKRECRTQTAARFDASHLSLHGLWPQPQSLNYCGVPARERATDERRRWEALPWLNLKAETRRQLEQAMPGTTSGLERHEWVRHGSCFGSDAETYFRTALALLDQVNESQVRETLAERVGETVTARQLKNALEQSFGPGAGRALGLRCSRDGTRKLISEIRIKLRHPVTDSTRLKDALDLSSPASSNCSAGVVDRVGLD